MEGACEASMMSQVEVALFVDVKRKFRPYWAFDEEMCRGSVIEFCKSVKGLKWL